MVQHGSGGQPNFGALSKFNFLFTDFYGFENYGRNEMRGKGTMHNQGVFFFLPIVWEAYLGNHTQSFRIPVSPYYQSFLVFLYLSGDVSVFIFVNILLSIATRT